MIGPVACLSKEYLAQWPYERLQRPRSPTRTCSITHPSYFIDKTGACGNSWQLFFFVCLFSPSFTGPWRRVGPGAATTVTYATAQDPIFCCWFYIFLENVEIILLFHYSIYCLWSRRSTGSKTAAQHCIKMGPEKSSAIINHNHSEEVKRPCYKHNLIHTTSCNHQNWLVKLLNVYFWSNRFGHISRRPILNWHFQSSSWRFFVTK